MPRRRVTGGAAALLERRHARASESHHREQPEEHAAQHRYPEREEQHVHVYDDVVEPRQLRRRDRAQQLDRGPGKQDAHCPARNREHDALRQQPARDAAVARPEGRPHRELLLPALGAHEEQVRVLDLPEDPTGRRCLANRVTRPCVELFEDRRLEDERARVRVETIEHLSHQVVAQRATLGQLGDHVLDRVAATNRERREQLGGVGFLFLEHRREHVAGTHLITAGALHMQYRCLQHAPEGERLLRLAVTPAAELLERFREIRVEVDAELTQVCANGCQNLFALGVVRKRVQQVFERQVRMPPRPGLPVGDGENDFQSGAEHVGLRYSSSMTAFSG